MAFELDYECEKDSPNQDTGFHYHNGGDPSLMYSCPPYSTAQTTPMRSRHPMSVLRSRFNHLYSHPTAYESNVPHSRYPIHPDEPSLPQSTISSLVESQQKMMTMVETFVNGLAI